MRTLTWKVATMHMPKQEIIPNARAAVLRSGLTCVTSSLSFSTNLYLAYIVAVPVKTKKTFCAFTTNKNPLASQQINSAFIFLKKGKCDYYLWKAWFFLWESPKLPNRVTLREVRGHILQMFTRVHGGVRITCACRNECHQAEYAALGGVCSCVTEKSENIKRRDVIENFLLCACLYFWSISIFKMIVLTLKEVIRRGLSIRHTCAAGVWVPAKLKRMKENETKVRRTHHRNSEGNSEDRRN